MGFKIILALLVSGWASAVRGEDLPLPTLQPPAPEVAESVPTEPISLRLYDVAPQVSVISVSRLALANPSHRVAYAQSFEGLHAFQINVGRSIAEWKNLVFAIQGSVGYGRKSAVYSVLNTMTSESTSENLSISWIPMVLSTKISYRLSGFSYLRPSLTLGFGNITLVQSSSKAGLSRTTGIPMLIVSPQLTFLDPSSLHWLGGFSFGASWMQGLSGTSSLTATSIDLSLNFLL